MRKNNIITLEKAFFFLSEMTYKFFMQDLMMHRQGIIYKEKQHSYKFMYKLMASLFQIKVLVENENKKEILEKLQKMEKVLTEKTIESGKYEGPRILEKDFKLISWVVSRMYCIDMIEEIQGINKEEWLIKNTEDLLVSLMLRTYIDKRKEIKEKEKLKIIKEKATTKRMKKKK